MALITGVVDGLRPLGMIGVLCRDSEDNGAVLGTLVLADEDSAFILHSLELPWFGNARNVSCIPTGLYQAQYKFSGQRGHVYEIDDVPGRTAIQIHVGNTAQDTEGCILAGTMRGVINGKPAVLNSRTAMASLMTFTQHKPIALRVCDRMVA